MCIAEILKISLQYSISNWLLNCIRNFYHRHWLIEIIYANIYKIILPCRPTAVSHNSTIQCSIRHDTNSATNFGNAFH